MRELLAIALQGGPTAFPVDVCIDQVETVQKVSENKKLSWRFLRIQPDRKIKTSRRWTH